MKLCENYEKIIRDKVSQIILTIVIIKTTIDEFETIYQFKAKIFCNRWRVYFSLSFQLVRKLLIRSGSQNSLKLWLSPRLSNHLKALQFTEKVFFVIVKRKAQNSYWVIPLPTCNNLISQCQLENCEKFEFVAKWTKIVFSTQILDISLFRRDSIALRVWFNEFA